MATPVWMPNTLCLVPLSLGLARTSPPKSITQHSANSSAMLLRNPSKATFSMKLRLVTMAITPSSVSRSEAQRQKRTYMSDRELVFWALLRRR